MIVASLQKPGQVRGVYTGLTPARAVLLLILLTSIVRVVVASAYGLGFDESYMVANSRVFALSYLDGPPLHIWLVRVWSLMTGSESAGVLRLPFIALFAGSTWLMYLLTAQLFGARPGFWAAIAFNLAPVFTFAHASWILPDGPLIFFLLAGACIVTSILFTNRPANPALWWVAAGLCGGLAFLSKYHGVFFFLAVFVFLLTVPQQRRWLATPGPWLGVLAALVIALPAIIWNLQQGGAGIAFHADRLEGLLLANVVRSVGGQLLYLALALGVILAWLLVRAVWHGPSQPETWLLALLATGPILFFTGVAFFSQPFPHWPMPGWLFTFPLFGVAWASLELQRPRLASYSAIALGVLITALVAGFTAQATSGVVGSAIPGLFKPNDITADVADWGALPAALRERRLIDASTPAVAAVHWMEGGKTDYALGGHVPVLCLCERPQQFGVSQNLQHFAGKNLILVGTDRQLGWQMPKLATRFERIERLPPVLVRRAGEPVLELLMYRGINFKP